MNYTLPDLGDLLLIVAVLFAGLILLFETLERRRESRQELLYLEEIAREYALYRSLGRF